MRLYKIELSILILLIVFYGSNFGVSAQQSSNKPVSGPGIYLVEVTNGIERLVLIEPTNYTNAVVSAQSIRNTSSTDNSARSRISVEGARAKVKVDTLKSRPRFYLYFARGNAAYNLNDFVLARMDTDESRRVLTGKLNNPFEIDTEENRNKKSTGIIVNSQVRKIFPLEFETTSEAVRVTPIDQLIDGEYCFFYRGSTSLFDLFSLRKNESAFCFSASRLTGTPYVPERHP